MKVILDNGHGRDTAGKRSPDGRLREYAYAREMARKIAQDLKRQGIFGAGYAPSIPLPREIGRKTPRRLSIRFPTSSRFPGIA